MWDWLRRAGAGLANIVGGAANNVGRFVQQNNPINQWQQIQRQLPQAQQQVNRQVQQQFQQFQRNLPRIQAPRYTPPPQLRQVQNLNIPRLANISADTARNVLSNIGRGTQQQFNRTALAQTPKLAPIAIKNLQNIGGNALSGAYNTFFPVTNQALNTYKDLGNRGAAVSAQLAKPIYKPFLNNQQQARYNQGVGNLYRKADSYQKVGLDPQAKIAGGDFGEFAKTLAVKGTGAGLEIAPVVTGMPGGAKLSTKLLRGGSLGAGANTAYSALTGQYTNKTPAELAQQFAIDVAGGYGGELLGHGLGKVGRGGQTLAKEAKALDSAERASNGGFVGGFAKLPEKGKKEIANISKASSEAGIQRGFISNVKSSKSTLPEVANSISGNYTPKDNDNLVTTARKLISSDIELARKSATTDITDNGVATASELIKHYQALGDYTNAIDVAQQAAKNLTEAGRAVQAASIYSRISPEGILRYTQAQIDKVGGKKLAPNVAKRLTDMAREVQIMPDGEEKLFATAKLYQDINKQIPTGTLQKLTTLRKAGLLTGLRTQVGNAVSNLSHIGLNKVSDIPAAGIDAMMSLFTGQRTKTLTLRGLASGGKEGAQKAVKFLKTGVDELGLDSLSKYDYKPVNFKNKAVQKYVDTVFNLMGAADKPYRYAALKTSLYDQALAAAKTQKLRGSEAGKFVKDFVANPPTNAVETAVKEAEKSVFANDTALSSAATAVRNAVQKKSSVGGAAIDVIMPFTKVPSAVVTRVFDYTPAGAVKEAVRQIKNKSLDQRALAQALGTAGTGTGAIYLGFELAKNGMITGSQPTNNREADLWTLEGKQPNSILLGGRWYSFNYVSPIGQLLQAGVGIANAAKEGQNAVGALLAGAGTAGKAVVDQSFLQGVSGALEAINDPTRYAQNFFKSNAGSVVPTLVADFARGTDSLQRQTNNVVDAVQARVPGLRLGLLPKQDVFGNVLQGQGLVNSMLDPFRSSPVKGNPLTTELRRLQDANNGVLPNDNNKTITVGKEKVNLNPGQLTDQNKRVGQQTQSAWNYITTDPRYGAFNDDDKRKVLDNVLSDINAVEKYRTLLEIRPDLAQQVYDKLTKNQLKLLNGEQIDYLAKNDPKAKIAKIKTARKSKKGTGRKRVARARKGRGRRARIASTKIALPKVPKLRLYSSAPRANKVRLAKLPTIKRSGAKPLAKVSTISKVRLRSNA